MDDKEDRIRARAHKIWESEGRPHGSHDRHWKQAMDEVESEQQPAVEDAAPADKPKKGRAPKKV